jgi:hypothetical protein
MPYAHVSEAVIEKDGELHVSGLPLKPGDRVRVFIIPEASPSVQGERYPLHGSPGRYDDPFEPVASPDEWEANR